MGIKGFRSWFESQFPNAITGMPKEGQPEEFDHVLVDLNQLLHVVLRRSRSDGHGLTLLMKELDLIVQQLATPNQSLVLAMDGAPGAAKLATQRKRRFQTVCKTDLKVKQIDKFLHSGNHKNSKRAAAKAKKWTRKKRKALSETRTLCITPATDFMKLAEHALLYWAWQRLQSRNNILSQRNVKIFISPSTVAGEGEVKLLEWIYSKQRRGESIAILGGDSDLVLEGLVIPLASSHNVFVLLPDGKKRYLSVSLWEATRTLYKLLLRQVSITSMVKVRTDLVLLLILNGNDYLPKLRGSSGFNKLFHTYLRLYREWIAEGKVDCAYLVDPDTLEFNLEFGIAFFGRLAALAPSNVWTKDTARNHNPSDRRTPLQQLNNMVEAGFLPSPIEFLVNRDEDDNRIAVRANSLDDDDDDDDDDEVENSNYGKKDDDGIDDEDSSDDDFEDESGDGDEEIMEQNLVRLLLGEPGSEDFYAYEIWQPMGAPLKQARHKLAEIALADFLDEQSDSEGKDEDLETLGISNFGYDWEIRKTLEGRVDSYLYGLLWNLQTYQDGVCSDYAYNYGKRLSPLAREIKEFFEVAQKEKRSIGPRDLFPPPFSPPPSAGISCLAALPAAVKHLVPEPYRLLPDETVEEFYASCMDPNDNVFDIKRFEQLCEDRIDTLNLRRTPKDSDSREVSDGRRIILSDHFWTVIGMVPKPLKHPFDPPKPFSDRLSRLKRHDRIRVSRYVATAGPRPRAVWTKDDSHKETKGGFVHKEAREFSHSDPGPFLGRLDSVEQVDYRLAYQKSKKKERRGIRKGKMKIISVKENAERPMIQNRKEGELNGAVSKMPVNVAVPKDEEDPMVAENAERQLIQNRKDDVYNGALSDLDVDFAVQRIEEKSEVAVDVGMKSDDDYIHQPPPAETTTNKDGTTAMAILKQLAEIEMIGPLQWETFHPSPSEVAATDPVRHELIRLTVPKGLNPKICTLHEDLTYEQDRHQITGGSRKAVQQHLASFALCDITGPTKRWSELSYKELKSFLLQSKVKQ